MKVPWITRDSTGFWLTPAFTDQHSHPLFAAREQNSLKIAGASAPENIVTALREHLELHGDLEWLDVLLTDDLAFDELNCEVLDRASMAVPIVVHAADRHNLWANTAAMMKAGIFGEQLPLTDGEIVLNAEGTPVGIFREWSAMKLILDHAPIPTPEHDLASLISADSQLRAAGFISVSDAWIDESMFEVYLNAADQGALQLEYKLWFRVSHGEMAAQLAYLANSLLMLQSFSDGKEGCKISIGGVKVFLDGVISSQTAALDKPYLDGTFVEPIWTLTELDALLREVANINPELRPHFHAIGDAAVGRAVAAVQNAMQFGIWSGGARATVAHAELVSTSDLAQMKALNIDLVVSPQWLADQQDASKISEHQRNTFGDFGRLVAAGLNVGYGSDWPVSEPNALEAIATGISWLEANETLHGATEAQKLTFEQKIEMLWRIASGPAWNNQSTKLAFRENPLEVARKNPKDLSKLNFEVSASE